MKTKYAGLATILALGSLLGFGPVTQAQEKKDEKKDEPKVETPAPRRAAGRQALQDRLKHVAEELKLTDEQKEKLKPAFHEEAEKLKTLRADTNASRKDKVAKLREIQEATNAKLAAVLTDEQKEKWEKVKAEQSPVRRKKQ